MNTDIRRHAPAVARNRDAILDVLRLYLPSRGLVLEVASGSGEHAVHFAEASPAELRFQPTDPDPEARISIDAWTASTGLANVAPALALDATSPTWPVERAEIVICVNMIHDAPWAATIGLMRGAARVLTPDGTLLVYGPFRRGGKHTAPSNAAFDESLRARDPAAGVRDLESVVKLARASGFEAPEIHEMPANNLSLAFRRGG